MHRLSPAPVRVTGHAVNIEDAAGFNASVIEFFARYS